MAVLGPLLLELADGDLRLLVHATLGAVHARLFYRSGLAGRPPGPLLDSTAHACLSTSPGTEREVNPTCLTLIRHAQFDMLTTGLARGTGQSNGVSPRCADAALGTAGSETPVADVWSFAWSRPNDEALNLALSLTCGMRRELRRGVRNVTAGSQVCVRGMTP